MKNKILIACSTLIISYLAVSFIALQLNPLKWDEFVRVLFVGANAMLITALLNLPQK